MSFPFFKHKAKTPADLVRQTRDALEILDTATGDGRPPESLPDSSEQSVDGSTKPIEGVAQGLAAMKVVFCGDGEAVSNAAASGQLTLAICQSNDFLELLISCLSKLTWEMRKDVEKIVCNVLKQRPDIGNTGMEYIEKHPTIFSLLIRGLILESSDFLRFFHFIESPNFDLGSDAFTTFKFFNFYNQLLLSDNYVARRQSLKLLGGILLDRTYKQIMLQYISDTQNLRQMMMLLRDPRKNIQFEAFHVFKIFVANPNKTQPIVDALARNGDMLLKFLDTFHVDKEDEQFEEEKLVVKKGIKQLLPIPS
eukprot:SM000004S14952  [mRNA]  locus=s4:445687:448436:+ [translate_table: standard]